MSAVAVVTAVGVCDGAAVAVGFVVAEAVRVLVCVAEGATATVKTTVGVRDDDGVAESVGAEVPVLVAVDVGAAVPVGVGTRGVTVAVSVGFADSGSATAQVTPSMLTALMSAALSIVQVNMPAAGGLAPWQVSNATENNGPGANGLWSVDNITTRSA